MAAQIGVLHLRPTTRRNQMDSVSRALLMAGGQSGPVQGQQAYTTPGSYSFIVPAGVTSISVVCVSGGGGALSALQGGSGTGGNLGYANNIAVTPGETLSVVVGAGGSGNLDNDVSARGGRSTLSRGATQFVSVRGGYWSNGGSADTNPQPGLAGTGGSGAGGGGGAGGYSGNGGAPNTNAPAGGGGGGGADRDIYYPDPNTEASPGCGGGGGVGLLGEGASGTKGPSSGTGGRGGSGGGNGGDQSSFNGGVGGSFGGGGGMGGYLYDFFYDSFNYVGPGGNGGNGAVRIIWPGNTRQFPSTNTGNV